MKWIDEIYDTFKYHFSADEEDMYPIVYGLLETKSREEIFKQLEELCDAELNEMVTLFILDQLQKKLAEEGIGRVTLGQDYTDDYIQ
ncbi:DUF6154 family protein [Pseudalkalibacillus salsuginis]|uniref:DUF6154 family protein n=1 Tax=Pseudalkalibacillus salsuginis TaxID=2910972 RepID=UPI001F410E4F|nr:DUF6154 family protein [Pseudalkalibacillus salsuginis]MCF6409346.1 DUF6154 family protein [Pseudalkalibacillus salsuginis]